jgi:type III secretion protein C
LFDINAGVVLRVTPHIIEEKQRELVKLAVQIEDSDVLEEEVDDIPIVKRSVVNTQAVVGKNESLLIGGYIKERQVTAQQNVPCLGKIPLLGWLFKQQADNNEQYERLFLITPTIKERGETNQMASSVSGLPIRPDDDPDQAMTAIQ